jgi:hypothetical protein
MILASCQNNQPSKSKKTAHVPTPKTEAVDYSKLKPQALRELIKKQINSEIDPLPAMAHLKMHPITDIYFEFVKKILEIKKTENFHKGGADLLWEFRNLIERTELSQQKEYIRITSNQKDDEQFITKQVKDSFEDYDYFRAQLHNKLADRYKELGLFDLATKAYTIAANLDIVNSGPCIQCRRLSISTRTI